MTVPFPYADRAGPGKDAFEFWISFFPTAPLFGVDWRFADMIHPAMAPFIQADAMPFPAPFPGPRAAGAAARPGEPESPARADERQAEPLATAVATAAEAALDAGRLVADAAGMAATSHDGPDGDGSDGAAATGPEAEGPWRHDAPDAVAAHTVTAARPGADRSASDHTGSDPEPHFAALFAETAAETAATQHPGEPRREASSEADAADEVDEALAAAPAPDLLLAERPDDPDDLTELKGIGPVLQGQLNELGIWTLAQIARMSEADLVWVDEHLTTVRGRSFRYDWIGQAKARTGL